MGSVNSIENARCGFRSVLLSKGLVEQKFWNLLTLTTIAK
jgi:hypothetical protein